MHLALKGQLRRDMQRARAVRGGSSAVACSAEACRRVAALPVFRAAARVVLYVATNGELDPDALHRSALLRGKRVFLPAMWGDELEFVEDDGGRRRLGRWGIPEPAAGKRLGPSGPETLFVLPGLAFDLRGHRLGRGYGAYDRGLGRYATARRIGLAYEFQLFPLLPTAPWDVPVEAVVTNARIVRARCAGGRTEEIPQ